MNTSAVATQPQRTAKFVSADAPTPEGVPLVDRQLVKAWFLSSMCWMVVGPVLGLIAAMKLDDPYFLGGIEWLAFPRMRVAHVNGVVFGLFSTAIFGFMCYAVPKLCGRPLVNIRMAWWGFGIFNFAVLLGEICILAGYIQPVEAGEYPLVADLIATVGFILCSGVILQTIAKRRHKHMYVSLWYWTAGLLWTLINLPLGSLVLPRMNGATSAAMHGFYLHNVVGLWITPMGLGVVYYLIPSTLRSRLYSHKLSMIGFWALAFFYALNGVHHYIYSPIADWAQTISICASLMLFVPVVAFSINMWGTMRGNWGKYVGENYVIKFSLLGCIWYLITCTQGPLEAFRGMQRLTHFGDFNVGHAHSAVYGAFSIWMMAAAYYAIPRVTGRRIWSWKLAGWHYWMQIFGFSLMFLVLTIDGLIQGHMLLTAQVPWIDTVIEIKPYWIARTIGGTIMDVGLALFFYNIVMTLLIGQKVPIDSHERVTHEGQEPEDIKSEDGE